MVGVREKINTLERRCIMPSRAKRVARRVKRQTRRKGRRVARAVRRTGRRAARGERRAARKTARRVRRAGRMVGRAKQVIIRRAAEPEAGAVPGEEA
jgi:hypothetical protein